MSEGACSGWNGRFFISPRHVGEGRAISGPWFAACRNTPHRFPHDRTSLDIEGSNTLSRTGGHHDRFTDRLGYGVLQYAAITRGHRPTPAGGRVMASGRQLPAPHAMCRRQMLFTAASSSCMSAVPSPAGVRRCPVHGSVESQRNIRHTGQNRLCLTRHRCHTLCTGGDGCHDQRACRLALPERGILTQSKRRLHATRHFEKGFPGRCAPAAQRHGRGTMPQY